MLQPCLLSTCLAPAQLTVDTIPRQPAIPQGDKMISDPEPGPGCWGLGHWSGADVPQAGLPEGLPAHLHTSSRPGLGLPRPLAPGPSRTQSGSAPWSFSREPGSWVCMWLPRQQAARLRQPDSHPLRGRQGPAGRAQQACVGASRCLPVRPLPAEVLPTPAGVSLLLGPRGPSRGMRGHW